jgi:hypothetical protein
VRFLYGSRCHIAHERARDVRGERIIPCLILVSWASIFVWFRARRQVLLLSELVGLQLLRLFNIKPIIFIRKRKVCLLGNSEPVAKPGVDKIKKT